MEGYATVQLQNRHNQICYDENGIDKTTIIVLDSSYKPLGGEIVLRIAVVETYKDVHTGEVKSSGAPYLDMDVINQRGLPHMATSCLSVAGFSAFAAFLYVA